MPDSAKSNSEVRSHWQANADTWTEMARRGYDVSRDRLNTPAFLAMLPPIRGLRGLDIGCGEGSNTRKLAEQGADLDAIDFSERFITHASAGEKENPTGIRFQVGDAMKLPFPDRAFDFATAFMCLMDVPDPGLALREAYRVLRPGGFLQFSILHPCFVPPYRKVVRENGVVRCVEVSDYFERIDGRVDVWHFGAMPLDQRNKVRPFRIPRFHRTLSEWVEMLVGAGFAIQKLGEPSASAEAAKRYPILDDTRKVPLFLHVLASKGGAR